MNQTYTALIQQRGDWWIGWIEEIPGVNCQERTREDLLDTLRITLLEALEFNRQEAISIAESGYQEIAIQI
jgi:predicted RNase H-like HicB family nuclease